MNLLNFKNQLLRQFSWQDPLRPNQTHTGQSDSKLTPIFNDYTILDFPHIQDSSPVNPLAAVFQNEVLRIAVNAPWSVTNDKLHKELDVSYIKNFQHNLTANTWQMEPAAEHSYWCQYRPTATKTTSPLQHIVIT